MGNKPETITIRVSTEFKNLAFARARAQNRSVTSYLEWLVMQEAQATGQVAQTGPKKRRG